MKNKVLTIIAIVLAFVAGGELTYIITKGDNKVQNNNSGGSTYNSCSECMS